MQNDLTDGVKWAVAQGIADPKRVAIDGISYGGYAALAGAAFTPDMYRCSVDVCGPSNLFTTIKSFPPYDAAMRGIWDARVGDPDNRADKELLTKASPLFSADKIRIPMLIGQGANDPRVIRAESEQIVTAIMKNDGHVTYVLYRDEGHGFARVPNRLDFAAREEKFLADNLGGRYEPMTQERMPGSTAVVKVIGN
jgi:dipeptidyl aminopeptidase/acylaminoacyl peptidase